MLRAVVFDLDGTLLDTIPDIAGALNRALAAQGLPTHPVRTCAGFVGGGIREAVKKAAPPDASEETLQAILDGYRGDYVAHCTEKTACYPGVPELLEGLEPDLNLASTLLMLKDQIPKKSKESARKFIRRIVEEINRMLENDVRRAVTAALNRRAHSPLPSAAAIDFPCTIRRNLQNYNPELKAVIPDRVWFFDRSSKVNRWHVILDIDQSGSMGQSIIYSSVMACVLASMSAVKTSVVAFDTQIMDLTPLCADPVDLLFGFQMGGGTDIAKSIAYCQGLIESPAKTLFFLISDLYEGGNRAALLRRVEELKSSGVNVVVLLAIADGGKPFYDPETARRISAMGIPCFACAPERLPELLERTLKGQSLDGLAANAKQ